MKKDARRHNFAPTQPLARPLLVDEFKGEVRAWAAHLDVEPVDIRVASMRRKWASCSTKGRVTFDSELLAQSKSVRREVIVHELLHMKVPNHGPLFRALLTTHLAGQDHWDGHRA